MAHRVGSPVRKAELQLYDESQMELYARAAVEAAKPAIIAQFLGETGQYVTNDASREAAIAEAVEADRKSRGEPVAEVTHCREDNYGTYHRIRWLAQRAFAVGTKLYTDPQPAEPVVNQSLTTAELAREPSDEELIQFLRDVGDEIYVVVDGERVYLDKLKLARALLSRYGQPAASAETDVDDKGHPRFIVGYQAGLKDAKLSTMSAAQPAASAGPWKPLWDDIMGFAEDAHTPTATRMKEWAWQVRRLAAPVAAQPHQAEHDRNNLMRAITEAAIRLGIARTDLGQVSGPECLQLLHDIEEQAAKVLDHISVVEERDHLREVVAAQPSVPKPLDYSGLHKDHYVTGWNDCRAAMLCAPVAASLSAPESVIRVLNKLWEAIQGMEHMPGWQEVARARADLRLAPAPKEDQP